MLLVPTGYKTKGFYFSNSSFAANTYGLSDIFTDDTVIFLNNQSFNYLKEIRSLFFGRCFTICFRVRSAQSLRPNVFSTANYLSTGFFILGIG